MARPIHQLRNLGPRCEEMLAAIGITDSDQLRRIGAVLKAFSGVWLRVIR